MRKRTVGLLLAWLMATPFAWSAATDLEDFVKGEWCAVPEGGTSSEISPDRLYRELLAATAISDDARDIDGDLDATFKDTMTAIADPDRCGPRDPTTRPKCRKGDREKLWRAHALLENILNSNGQTVRTPTHLVTIRQLQLQKGDVATDVRLVLQRNPRRYALECTQITSGTRLPPKQPRVEAGAVVRGKVTDLTAQLSKDSAGKVSAASVSYKNDAHGNAESFAVEGVAGFVFSGPGIAETGISALSPYVRIERKKISKDDKMTTDVNNVGLGILAGKYFVFDGLTLDATIRPEMVTSEFDSLVFYSEVGIDIIPELPCFGANYRLGLVDAWCQFRVVGDFGTVLSDGGKATLVALDDYSRAGADVSLSISGNDESWLDPFQISLAYKNLRDFSGSVRNDLRRFEGAFSYTFADTLETGRFLGWEVSIKYVNGEADVTLQDQEFTQLSLGVKY